MNELVLLVICFFFYVTVPVVCGSLPDIYVEKLLGFVAACLEKSGHLQFYMTWAQNLLMLHGQKLKNRFTFVMCVYVEMFLTRWKLSQYCSLFIEFKTFSMHSICVDKILSDCTWLSLVYRSGAILPTLQALQKSIKRHFDDLSKL